MHTIILAHCLRYYMLLGTCLVSANTTSFQRFGRQLLVLIGNQVNAEGEVFYASLLPAQIENPDLGIWDTSTETRLGVWLVFAIPVAKK